MKQNFTNLALKPYIHKALTELKFEILTPIQTEVIPRILKGQSLIGKSLTGSGKTHSFLIPLFQQLDEKSSFVDFVIMAPTRELANQLYQEAIKIAKHSEYAIDIRLYVGGKDVDQEVDRLHKKQPQIAIGTLGRIHDLAIQKNALKIHNAKSVVIDEADMFFDLEELEQIDQIFGKFTDEIQILLFSATMSENLITFMNQYLHKLEYIDLTEKQLSKASIEHIFIPTKNKDKKGFLMDLLHLYQPFLALIFANTKETVDELAVFLGEQQFKVAKITGDLPARERNQILRRIKNLEFQYVVASDIASRGIDILGVSHVINYELPDDIEFYIHRTGRTARHQFTGVAVSLYDYDDNSYIRSLEKKGLSCVYRSIKDGELIPIKALNARQKRTKQEMPYEQELHAKTPMPKKVKPGYKKKRKLAIEKELQKQKRKHISSLYHKKSHK